MGVLMSWSIALGCRPSFLRRIDQPYQIFPDRDGIALRIGAVRIYRDSPNRSDSRQ